MDVDKVCQCGAEFKTSAADPRKTCAECTMLARIAGRNCDRPPHTPHAGACIDLDAIRVYDYDPKYRGKRRRMATGGK